MDQIWQYMDQFQQIWTVLSETWSSKLLLFFKAGRTKKLVHSHWSMFIPFCATYVTILLWSHPLFFLSRVSAQEIFSLKHANFKTNSYFDGNDTSPLPPLFALFHVCFKLDWSHETDNIFSYYVLNCISTIQHNLLFIQKKYLIISYKNAFLHSLLIL